MNHASIRKLGLALITASTFVAGCGDDLKTPIIVAPGVSKRVTNNQRRLKISPQSKSSTIGFLAAHIGSLKQKLGILANQSLSSGCIQSSEQNSGNPLYKSWVLSAQNCELRSKNNQLQFKAWGNQQVTIKNPRWEHGSWTGDTVEFVASESTDLDDPRVGSYQFLNSRGLFEEIKVLTSKTVLQPNTLSTKWEFSVSTIYVEPKHIIPIGKTEFLRTRHWTIQSRGTYDRENQIMISLETSIKQGVVSKAVNQKSDSSTSETISTVIKNVSLDDCGLPKAAEFPIKYVGPDGQGADGTLILGDNQWSTSFDKKLHSLPGCLGDFHSPAEFSRLISTFVID